MDKSKGAAFDILIANTIRAYARRQVELFSESIAGESEAYWRLKELMELRDDRTASDPVDGVSDLQSLDPYKED